VADWPVPRSVRGLRGFLGLAGYYRKFIKDYGLIASPLTKLLKEGFRWDGDPMRAFKALKDALSSAPVLQMLDFSSRFIVECDASGSGFGAVFHQGDGPLAFYSRSIAARHAKLAAYERELIGLVQAVQHWRPYLWGREFTVRTDHYSLKFILDQRLSTIPQHQWVSKLFGYDFSVEYRPGRLNTVADALSRRDAEEELLEACALLTPCFALYDDLRSEIAASAELSDLRSRILSGQLDTPWSCHDYLILYGCRVHVSSSSQLLPSFLEQAHAAHEGVQKTLHRLRASFQIPGD
jgi:hypothetical protein